MLITHKFHQKVNEQIKKTTAVSKRFGKVLCYNKLLGNYNLEGPDMFPATGELQFTGSCPVASYWGMPICRGLFCIKLLENSNLRGSVMLQASGKFQFVLSHVINEKVKVVFKRFGRVLFHCKLLGNFSLQGLCSLCRAGNCAVQPENW